MRVGLKGESLGEVERASSIMDGAMKLDSENFLRRVVGHLQVLRERRQQVSSICESCAAETYLGTSHDTRQVVVGLERRLVGFPDDCKGGSETLETANGQLGRASDAT